MYGRRGGLAAKLPLLCADAVVCLLSFLEHGRNVGPSALLTTYLAMTISSNVITTALLYVGWSLCDISSLAIISFVVRILLFALESQTKRLILREPEVSLEETAGFFGSVSFWWVNTVLRNGYSNVLSLDDMPRLDASLDAKKIHERMNQEWEKRSRYPV